MKRFIKRFMEIIYRPNVLISFDDEEIYLEIFWKWIPAQVRPDLFISFFMINDSYRDLWNLCTGLTYLSVLMRRCFISGLWTLCIG